MSKFVLRLGLVWVAAVSLAGCVLAPFPTLPTPGAAGAQAVVYPMVQGWYAGQAQWYYNLGSNTPLDPAAPDRVLTAPVWVFVAGINADGSPEMLPGQDNLFDTRAGQLTYTDLWQATFVTPAAGYGANSIRSAADLVPAGLTAVPQDLFVNCPEVPPGSSLSDRALPLKTGWVRGEQITYFDFGPTDPHPGNVYVLVTGFAADGTPQLVDGQYLVFDAAPGATGYSDFWRVQWVTVGAGYAANSLRSAADIDPAQVTPSSLVMNFPHL